MNKATLSESAYIVKRATIVSTKKMTEFERYFEIALSNSEDLDHEHGQFIMVSIPGVGDAPFCVYSSPTRKGSFELVVRNVGKLTGVLHKMKAGDTLGIRGPFGKGFPVERLKGNDLLFVVGGLGIIPLRSLINLVIDNRRDFGKVEILFGCKTPKDMLLSNEVSHWSEKFNVGFNCTVDRPDPDWQGNVGPITSLIPGVDIDPIKTFAVVAGPPIMYRFVIKELINKGISQNRIYLSLERHMKCGVGKCGHCQIGQYYCCRDGPVFCLDEIKDNVEAL